MRPTVLVAGVGNIFLGDDGFGVEVARRLSEVDMPDWVRVADYGIRGLHLAYDLVGGEYDLTILADATSRDEPPGTVYVVELDTPAQANPPAGEETAAAARFLDAHGMQPDVVLNLVAMLGGEPGQVLLVGCEPAALEHRMSLSPVVERAVDVAVRAVLDLLDEHGPPSETHPVIETHSVIERHSGIGNRW
ncbi:hydrogenase maturation protease [Solihabitans fulvus]|uniref:Hydrogenase maturation protease n=1 Tax=Solihabitans fulvus TaxID=1892852 RepID=A0A5B2XKG3_9PSEU|nr:hydrogenase maturation protease [Solihabitans fulvus]KAA2263390.1 hydrogenase maturation protease [Solihabitans fulvus]